MNSLSRKLSPGDRVVGLAVVAEARARTRAARRGARRACRPRRSRPSWWRRTTTRPASPHEPGRRPFQPAPCACAQSSIRKMPSLAAERGDRARPRTRCARRCARGSPPAAGAAPTLRLEVGERHAEVRRGCSRRTRPSAPACSAASGVAMNVFDGHSTVSPRTPANSSAASAAPVQPENATAPRPFQADQAASKRSVSGPSDQRWDVDHLVPQLVQARAVALVEADREPRERRASRRRRPPAIRQPRASAPAPAASTRRRRPPTRPAAQQERVPVPELADHVRPAATHAPARGSRPTPVHSTARRRRALGASHAKPPASTSGSSSTRIAVERVVRGPCRSRPGSSDGTPSTITADRAAAQTSASAGTRASATERDAAPVVRRRERAARPRACQST